MLQKHFLIFLDLIKLHCYCISFLSDYEKKYAAWYKLLNLYETYFKNCLWAFHFKLIVD